MEELTVAKGGLKAEADGSGSECPAAGALPGRAAARAAQARRQRVSASSTRRDRL